MLLEASRSRLLETAAVLGTSDKLRRQPRFPADRTLDVHRSQRRGDGHRLRLIGHGGTRVCRARRWGFDPTAGRTPAILARSETGIERIRSLAQHLAASVGDGPGGAR